MTDEAPKKRDKNYYLDKILDSIKTNGSMTRADIDKLLWDELPPELNDEQKRIRINNYLSELRKSEKIKNIGVDKYPIWVLQINL